MLICVCSIGNAESSYCQGHLSPEHLAQQVKATAPLPDMDFQESDLRRCEVVFLISLPFTSIISFLFFNVMYFISDTGYNFSLSNLPPEILPFTLFSAMFSSAMITINDYRLVRKKRREARLEDGSLSSAKNYSELSVGLSVERKF